MNSQELRALQEAYNQVYELDEEKVELKQRNKNEMQRKAGNLGREVVSSKKGPKRTAAMNRMGKLVSSIARDDEEKRFKTLGQSPAHNEATDLYDIILSHLLDEGYAETPEAAEAIMVNMSEDWRESIVEDGYNSSGRYDVGGGRTVGPVAGAVHSLFSGNLPKQRTYIPPSPRQGTNKPPATPSSKDDSGKLTDFGAGGGKAKLKTGMSVGQVERQGRMNKGDYSG